MLIHSKAIVLSYHRFSDNDVIFQAYTFEKGKKSFIIKNFFNSKKRKFILHPLLMLQMEWQHKELQTLTHPKSVETLNAYQLDVFQNSLSTIIAKVFNFCVKEEEKSESLFNFLETTVSRLQLLTGSYNTFLIRFLLDFARFVGIYPKIGQGVFFHPDRGEFYDVSSSISWNEQQSERLKFLLVNSYPVMNRAEERETIQLLLDFYHLHFESTKLQKVFEDFVMIFD